MQGARFSSGKVHEPPLPADGRTADRSGTAEEDQLQDDQQRDCRFGPSHGAPLAGFAPGYPPGAPPSQSRIVMPRTLLSRQGPNRACVAPTTAAWVSNE